jgi:hypothetical protein
MNNRPMKVGDVVEWNYEPKLTKNFFVRLIGQLFSNIKKIKT